MQDLERELAQYGTVLRDRAPAVDLDESNPGLRGPEPPPPGPSGGRGRHRDIGLYRPGVRAGAFIDPLGGAPSGGPLGPLQLRLPQARRRWPSWPERCPAILVGAAVVGLKRHHEKQNQNELQKHGNGGRRRCTPSRSRLHRSKSSPGTTGTSFLDWCGRLVGGRALEPG